MARLRGDITLDQIRPEYRRGLKFLCAPGYKYRDAISLIEANSVDTSPERIATPWGRALRQTALTNVGVQWTETTRSGGIAIQPATGSSTGSLTLFWIGQTAQGITSQDMETLFGQRYGTTPYPAVYLLANSYYTGSDWARDEFDTGSVKWDSTGDWGRLAHSAYQGPSGKVLRHSNGDSMITMDRRGEVSDTVLAGNTVHHASMHIAIHALPDLSLTLYAAQPGTITLLCGIYDHAISQPLARALTRPIDQALDAFLEPISPIFALGAVGGATDVTPTAGSLTVTGAAPTVIFEFNRAPGLGTLTLTGAAPTASTGIVVTPGLGTLTLTGASPTVTFELNRAPGLGTLTLTGAAPTASTGIVVAPGLGTLTLTGASPTVTFELNRAPGLGTLTLTGAAPTASTGLTAAPGLGTLTLTGAAPTITFEFNVAPGLGALTLTGLAPTATTGLTAAPGLGTLTLTGAAPTITFTFNVEPSLGTLTLTGAIPSISSSPDFTPGVGALVLTGYVPTIGDGTEAVEQDLGAGGGAAARREEDEYRRSSDDEVLFRYTRDPEPAQPEPPPAPPNLATEVAATIEPIEAVEEKIEALSATLSEMESGLTARQQALLLLLMID